MRKRKKKYGKIKGGIIRHQMDEIKSLKAQINELNISCRQKDELISSIDHMQKDFAHIIDDLKCKKEEYNCLIREVREMRDALNREIYKGKWFIIKWLLK